MSAKAIPAAQYRIDLPWPHKHLSPNARVHWAAKAKAVKKARTDAAWAARAAGIDPIRAETIRVTLTFQPPSRRKYDRDNLVASSKAYLDGLSDAICIDDNRFELAAPIVADPIPPGNVRIELEAI